MAIVLSLVALTATIFLMNPSDAAVNEPVTGTPVATPAVVAPLADCGVTPNELASVGGGTQAIVIQSGGVINGETVSVPIILSNAPSGLAGYYAEVSLDNPANARIASVEFPEFGITREVSNTGAAIQFAAADIMEIFQSGASNATIATLKVETMSEGSTGFQINVSKMDDDNGDPMHPQAATGSLTIC